MSDEFDFIGINIPEDLKKAFGKENFMGFLEEMLHPKTLKEDPRTKAMIDLLKSYTRSQEKLDKMTDLMDWYIKSLPDGFINAEAKEDTLKGIAKFWLPLILTDLTRTEAMELPSKIAKVMNTYA